VYVLIVDTLEDYSLTYSVSFSYSSVSTHRESSSVSSVLIIDTLEDYSLTYSVAFSYSSVSFSCSSVPYIRICVCVCVCTCLCVCVCVCVCVCLCVLPDEAAGWFSQRVLCVYTYIDVYTHIYIYMYI